MTAAASDEYDTVGARYLARLTDADLRALVRADRASTSDAAGRVAALRRQPSLIVDVLNRPDTSAELLNLAIGRPRDSALALISPFLVFAAAIHRTASDLVGSFYAPERTAPRMRIPVFDVTELADYLVSLRHRLLLADLLASFTRISGGIAVTQTPYGLRRRRWNDTDPVQLAVLLDSVGDAEQPMVWRRLGDLALFLAGVFPDAADRVAGSSEQAARLARRTGLSEQPVPRRGGLELLEWLGARWYRMAARRAQPGSGIGAAIADTAEHFMRRAAS